jgi:hypothetical protein
VDIRRLFNYFSGGVEGGYLNPLFYVFVQSTGDSLHMTRMAPPDPQFYIDVDSAVDSLQLSLLE